MWYAEAMPVLMMDRWFHWKHHFNIVLHSLHTVYIMHDSIFNYLFSYKLKYDNSLDKCNAFV